MTNLNDESHISDIEIKSLAVLQEQLMQGILYALSIAGLLTAGVGSFEALESSNEWLIPLYGFSYITVVLFTFWKKPSYQLRSWSLIFLLFVLGFTDFIADGLSGSGRLFLLSTIFLSGILLGRRASMLMIVASTLTMAGYGVIFSMGVLTVPGEVRSSQPLSWVISTLSLVMMQALIHVSLDFILPQLGTILEQSRKLTVELREYQLTLEEQVAERTERLTRRNAQLEATATIGREIVSIQDPETLLSQAVKIISDQLDYYHVAIYLTDKLSNDVVLKAASSEGGQLLIYKGHRLEAQETSIVGYVMSRGQARIALDVGQDSMFFGVPELPETRSEMALPLTARGQLIGVLDVQSSEPNAFDDQDIAVLQIMADQLAIAIFNAQLFQESEANLRIVQRAFTESSRKAWQELISRNRLRKRYDPAGILGEGENWDDLMKSAFLLGRSSADGNRLAIPIKERGEVIGVIRAYKPLAQDVWKKDELDLMDTLTGQLEVALESARLYEDTQRRARYEQTVGEISTRIRQTLDIESVIKTAVEEIGEKFALSRAEIRLKGDNSK